MFEVIENHKADIEALYKSGLSIREVAKTLNLKVGSIGSYIKYIGISRSDIKGKNNPFYGRTHSDAFKSEHSKRMKGSIPGNKGICKYGDGTVPRLLIENWKTNALRRNIDFLVSYGDIDNLWHKQSGLCALTKRKMSNKYNSKKNFKVSLDRIDNNKSYTIDNVQLVVGLVNIAKNTMSNLEFISLCKEVANGNG